jgi:RNA polymerase sigma-70 factor, ECF subfamily
MTCEPGTSFDDDLSRLRGRDPATIERWFLGHADALYTFVYYRVNRDEHLACDVVQETFSVALNRMGEYDPGRGTMLAWLTTLSKNSIRKALKEKGEFEAWEKIDQALLEVYKDLARTPLPDEALTRRETAELVQMTLLAIPGNYQAVLRRHYYENQPLHQIARSLKITEGAVKSLLHRARLAFKKTFSALSGSSLSAVSVPGGSHDCK